jgi:uncharacterized RDD family membrane protein YckC
MTTPTPTAYCSECGQPVSSEDLARFGDRLVCSNCKDRYAQKLREGGASVAGVRYGGFWLRFVAKMIDGIIMAIPMWIVQAMVVAAFGVSIFQRANPTPDEVLRSLVPLFGALAVSAVFGVMIGCAYEAFFVSKYSATPGKMALGLKIIRSDGSRVGPGRAAGRYFACIVSAMILYIGYIMAGFDAQKRALHDMICDTRVIKVRG